MYFVVSMPRDSAAVLVLADREEVVAELAPHDEFDDDEIQDGDREDDVVVPGLGVEGRDEEDPLRAVRELFPVHRDEPQDFRQRQDRQREVRSAQPEADPADDGRSDRRRQTPEEESRPRGRGRSTPLDENPGRVRSDPEESGVAERDLSRIAAEQVPALSEHDPHEDHDQHVEDVRVPRRHRDEDDRGGAEVRERLHARPFPSRPFGRKIRTRTKMMKPKASL